MIMVCCILGIVLLFSVCIAIDQHSLSKMWKRSYDSLYDQVTELKLDLDSAANAKIKKYEKAISTLPTPYQKLIKQEIEKE